MNKETSPYRNKFDDRERKLIYNYKETSLDKNAEFNNPWLPEKRYINHTNPQNITNGINSAELACSYMFPGKKIYQLSNNQKIELYASMQTKNALKPIFSEIRETGVRMKAVPKENKRGEDFYHH